MVKLKFIHKDYMGETKLFENEFNTLEETVKEVNDSLRHADVPMIPVLITDGDKEYSGPELFNLLVSQYKEG